MNPELRFTAEKIAKRLALIRPLIHKASHPIAPFRLETLRDASAKPGSGQDQGPVAWNSYWAGQDTHFVLRSAFSVPSGFANPALLLPLGVAGDIFTHPEALLHVDGQPIASADRHHHRIALDPALADDQSHDLMLQGWTGLTAWPPEPTNPTRLQINPCFVVDVDHDLLAFIVLAEVTLDVAQQRPEADRLRARMLQALDAAFLVLDTRHPMGEAFRASTAAAHALLQDRLKDLGPPMPERLHAIGHAHMDIAYLWPIAQIRQKNARTTSNVLRLMAQDTAFCFSHSQPQLYAYTAEDFPALFDAIKARVAEGRWEVMGGMWVESDCNIPGSEALVRQILLGRTYFQDQFGAVETPVLWLPDTFGFPWSLPQLMKQSGLEFFVTNKLNWNQYNRIPSSTIWWQGIDGSRVLTQFLTTPRDVQHLPFPTNYKSDLSAAEVIGTVEHANSGPDISEFLIAYGYGDGGGGPTEEQLLRAHALAAMPGAPRLEMGHVGPALRAIERQATTLPVWNDEFYLEGHRGTLTSQAWIKRANRLAERALHAAEAAMVQAWPEGAPDALRQRLDAVWKQTCLNQFHDIITGTSVPAVFADARRDYAHIQAEAAALQRAALEALQTGPGLGVFNPAAAPSAAIVTLSEPLSPRPEAGQKIDGGWLVACDPLPAYGRAAVTPAAAPPSPVTAKTREDGTILLENAILRVEIDGQGQLRSLWHKPAAREALAAGEIGNQLWAFEDRPLSWDAWDIDVFHEDRREAVAPPTQIDLVEDGPWRASVRLRRLFRNSRIDQKISLEAGSARLDFVTDVDWHEKHTLLKVAFPVSVHHPRARYEIQWGDIERPTHRNTSWDYARFEVPAQQWADLSEGGFGVALLNDCKYGHDIRDHVMRISLIKSSTSPDPDADQGRHHFTYSVLPHQADPGLVRAEARRLNNPLMTTAFAMSAPRFLQCDAANVVLETLKPAQDGRGFVIRLYEAERRRGPAVLRFGLDMAQIRRCSLLEEDGAPLTVQDNSVTLDLKPFEIVSLRCIPAPQKPGKAPS